MDMIENIFDNECGWLNFSSGRVSFILIVDSLLKIYVLKIF